MIRVTNAEVERGDGEKILVGHVGVPHAAIVSREAAVFRFDARESSFGLQTLPDLGHRLQRSVVLDHAQERGHVGVSPLLQLVGNTIAAPAKRHVVDERVGNGGNRFFFASFEVELLDGSGLGFVAVATGEIVVEVFPFRAHATQVESEGGLHRVATAIQIVAHRDLNARSHVEFFVGCCRKCISEHVAMARCVENRKPPAAISAASATFLGPIAAR